MVEVSEVRSILNNISADILPDDVIYDRIVDAANELEYLTTCEVPTQLVELAIKYKAAYMSYIAYLSQMERGIDVSPTPMMKSTLDYLKAEYERIINLIHKEYAPPSGRIPISTTDTLSDKK